MEPIKVEMNQEDFILILSMLEVLIPDLEKEIKTLESNSKKWWEVMNILKPMYDMKKRFSLIYKKYYQET